MSNTIQTLITAVPASDIDQLKRATGEAIADLNTPGWCEQAIRAQQVSAAREIIAAIPAMLREKGPKSWPQAVQLMELKRNDFKDFDQYDNKSCDTEDLTGVAAIVFQACKDAGLNPFVRRYRNTGGDHYVISLPVAPKPEQ